MRPKFREAMAAFGKLLDAIPKGKYGAVINDAAVAEGWMRSAAHLLINARKYFLEHAGGEESPFVKNIDELVDRPAAKPAAGQSGK